MAKLKEKLPTIITLVLVFAGIVVLFFALRNRNLDQLAIALALLFCAIVPGVTNGLEFAFSWNKAVHAILAVLGIIAIFFGWRSGMWYLMIVGVVLVVGGNLVGRLIKDPVRVDAWQHYFD